MILLGLFRGVRSNIYLFFKPGLRPDPNKPLCRKTKVVKAEKKGESLYMHYSCRGAGCWQENSKTTIQN